MESEEESGYNACFLTLYCNGIENKESIEKMTIYDILYYGNIAIEFFKKINKGS